MGTTFWKLNLNRDAELCFATGQPGQAVTPGPAGWKDDPELDRRDDPFKRGISELKLILGLVFLCSRLRGHTPAWNMLPAHGNRSINVLSA